MTNVINKATNKFTKGLVMDFSPENTGNEVLTHALNATLLTFNGNELSLQNDMGNARVETAFLPEGYIPVGTCEHGGIIYIVSYNPLEDKSLIGCFPSPERNISNDELGISDVEISKTIFLEYVYDELKNPIYPTGIIKNTSKYILLKNDKLNPGDKFIILTGENIYGEKLQDLYINNELVKNPILKISVVSIEDSGKITYLDSTLKQYEKTTHLGNCKYHILGSDKTDNNEMTKPDIDAYRNVLSSGYNIFKSKTSGKLALLVELITIDSYSVTHSIVPKDDSNKEFDIIIHTEVSPMPESKSFFVENPEEGIPVTPPSGSESRSTIIIKDNNYYLIPKLKYYYLEESQGILDIDPQIKLFNESGEINNNFYNTTLQTIYNNYTGNGDISDGIFDFPYKNTYHCNLILDNTNYGDKGIPLNLYVKFEGGGYYKIKFDLLNYIKTENPELLKDVKYYDLELNELNVNNINDNDIIYIKFTNTKYIKSDIFHPNSIDNNMHYEDIIEKGDRLYLYKLNDDYLISNNLQNIKYPDVKLGSIKIPDKIFKNGLPFPYIYNYTIVPCMEYGKLKDLKISNQINFNNLKNFENSKFNKWKYHIDGNQLKLTFGTEIYDSISNEKVTGLFLEFYDQFGFAGSLSIEGDRKSYSGEFTRILSLDTLNVLSNGKIDKNNKLIFLDNFSGNVNIIKDEFEKYSYFGKNCIQNGINWMTDYSINVEMNPSGGESQVKRGASQPNYYTKSLSITNDRFMLQSNLIYGVKAYFKIENQGKVYYKYIRPYILYTFPIYNDKYYSYEDFSELQPNLKLALTYKLTDESERKIYNDTSLNINDGYFNDDKINIDKYINGTYEQINLSAIKYYNYTGTTTLKLDVGLKKEYENIGFWIDPEDLENNFTCDLELIGDSETNTYYYESDIPDLNYNEFNIKNSLKFINDKKIISNVTLNNEFKIDYNFVVGYKFNITDIRTTEIPTTTFCALCHKKDNNSDYNYEDFNIKKLLYESNETYMSQNFFYSTGDNKICYLGRCSLKNLSGKSSDVLSVDDNSDNYTTNTDQTEYNKIQTLLIQSEIKYLGKYTFCLPHGHIYSDTYGTNLFKGTGEIYYLGRSYGDNHLIDGQHADITHGSYPTHQQYENPLFTTIPITYELLNYLKFISAIEACNSDIKNNYATYTFGYIDENKFKSFPQIVDLVIPFKGVTATNITKFNKNLLETMKSVYVYNPDYDTLKIKAGDVNLHEYNVKFISNIISNKSKITNEDKFNDYIKFYNPYFTISLYINNLYNNLNISDEDKNNYINNLTTFIPDYTYCGTKDIPYLISNLNYNIPAPKTLIDELSFKNLNTIIRDSEGNLTMYNSDNTLNKNVLYGIYNGKLTELHIDNYKINTDGSLKVLNDSSNNNSNYYTSGWHTYYVNDEYKDKCFKYSNITLMDLIYDFSNKHKLFLKNSYHYDDTNTRLYYREHNNLVNEFTNSKNKNYILLYYGPCYLNE